MLIVFVIVAALAVFAIAAAAVGATVARLSDQPTPAVLKLDDAVDWIADRLPFEVAARLSHDDVRRILQWHLDYFDEVGLSSEFGEELGGEVVPPEHDPVVAEADDSVDYVVGRAMAAGAELTPLQVVVVLDLQLRYLDEIGAIGPQAGDGQDPS
jgi:hypothetical protein